MSERKREILDYRAAMKAATLRYVPKKTARGRSRELHSATIAERKTVQS